MLCPDRKASEEHESSRPKRHPRLSDEHEMAILCYLFLHKRRAALDRENIHVGIFPGCRFIVEYILAIVVRILDQDREKNRLL
jgi:hypothetical protein